MTGPSQGHLPHRARWPVVGAFAGFVLVALAIRLPHHAPVAIAAAVVAVSAAALLLREPRPGLVLAFSAIATAAVAVLGHATSSNVGWFAVCVLGAWCVLAGGPRVGLLYLGGTVGLFGGEWLWAQRDPGWAAWIAGTAFSVLAALLVRHELDLVAQLRAAQAGLADRARAEERNRIARELHDIIAHSLTISLLHVSSARLAVECDPADAVRALVEAERLGRASLAEVRATVGLLRQEGLSENPAAPLPGLGAVPTLIEQFRAAGAAVTLTVDGDTETLPTTTGLAVYRIVQEALTNAVKHAPGAPITVDLRVDAETVAVAVDSAGKPHHGSGLGLISMCRPRTCTARCASWPTAVPGSILR